MATTQYIGARYVPLFAEPIEWDKTKQYEPLTIVTHNGNSYTSRQFVPTGIEINNEEFWALTGNYNAQIEQYRKEVTAYDGRITTAQNTADTAKTEAEDATAAVATEKNRAETAESEIRSLAETNETNISTLDAQMAGTQGSTLLTKINDESNRAKEKEGELESSVTTINGQMSGTSDSGLLTKIENVTAKFPVKSTDISDGAVTAPKLSNDAMSSIFAGLTVRHFDSSDQKADNEGLVVPNSSCRLAGYWVAELGMLVINAFNADKVSVPKVGGGATSAFRLPSYVNYPTSDLFVSRAAILVWDSGSNFKSWESLTINSNGYIGGATTSFTSSTSEDLFGSQVCFLAASAQGAAVTADVYDSFAKHNEVI